MVDSMNRAGLSALTDYSTYANGLLFDTLAKIDPAMLEGMASPSRGNVQTLVRHMFAVESFFFRSCQGQTFQPAETDSLAVPALRPVWARLAEERQGWVNGQTDEALANMVELQISEHTFTLPAWQCLTQSVIHSIHHRGELSIVLTEMGYPLPTLDAIIFFTEQSGQRWPWK